MVTHTNTLKAKLPIIPVDKFNNYLLKEEEVRLSDKIIKYGSIAVCAYTFIYYAQSIIAFI